MFTTLVAALSLTSSLSVDVPFLPQTDDLCGGAAVAMVFRYWGDAHADVQQFAPLVDRRAGGIADDVLVDAVRTRGWNATRFDGTLESLTEHLQARRPIVVLIGEGRDRYHYVVVTAVQADAVVVHDPSWGPSRTIRLDDFQRRWSAAHFWSLAIVPGAGTVRVKLDTPDALSTVRLKPDTADVLHDRCQVLLDRAIVDVRQNGLADADAILGRVRADCPMSAGPVRELAGVRFAERRWTEAAALARDALILDEHDAYALDVLGSSLFMLDDPVAALGAWNRIGKPRIDTVRIDGLHRSRYAAIAGTIDVRPNTLLTADAFALAERRVNELPDRSSARLTVRPDADGFATLQAVIAERPTLPRGATAWAGRGIQAGIDREFTFSLPGFTGQGDIWSVSWRWWANRPRAALGFAAPRVAGLPGVWRLEASWETETYAFGAVETPALVQQSRTHGGVTVSDWLTPSLRYTVGGGFDAWDASRKAASIGASVERRLFHDRVSLAADATKWLPVGSGSGFQAIGGRVVAQSPMEHRSWAYAAGAGAERVSDEAPFGLWPGAGDGHARVPLLRAHPLLDDGIIDATARSGFGRTLMYANGEAQRWLDRPRLLRTGFAAFVDVARASRQARGPDPNFGSDARTSSRVDAGAGLRVKLPGSDRVLRIDVAHGLGDGANALTVGWLF